MLLIIDIRTRRKNNIKSNEQYNKQTSDKKRKKEKNFFAICSEASIDLSLFSENSTPTETSAREVSACANTRRLNGSFFFERAV